jgi:hypothetical protein
VIPSSATHSLDLINKLIQVKFSENISFLVYILHCSRISYLDYNNTALTSIPRFLDSSYLKGLDFDSRKAPRYPITGIIKPNEPNHVYNSRMMPKHEIRTTLRPFLVRYYNAKSNDAKARKPDSFEAVSGTI